MSDNRKHDELAGILLHQLRNLIDGNQARAGEVVPGQYEAEDFCVRLLVLWSFSGTMEDSVTAGDASMADHFGYNGAAFARHSGELSERAACDTDLRAGFMDRLRVAGGKGVAESGRETAFHTFRPFSMHEQCQSCHGKGNVSCRSCQGSGRERCHWCGGSGQHAEQVPVYDGNSQYRGTRTVYKSCGGCWGSGYRTCGSCSGSGREKCGNCSGYGFFTRVREIQALAVPSYEVAADTRFAPQALSDLLARSGAEFCGEKIPFDLNGEQAGEKTHGMSYVGISTAVMLPFGLKGKTYICHAFSNPPYPYVRPTVFDDLFADELAFLQTNLSGKRKLGKKDAVAFFSRYAGQPVLDDAMRKIADCRTAQDEDTGHAVQTACQGFISTEMAGRLANVLNLIIDKVSPAYSPTVWVLSGLPVLAYLALLQEWDAEQNIAAKPFGTLLGGGLAFLLILLAVGIAASLLSMVVVAWQRRKVPPAYRQQMRHAEAFGKLFGWGFLVWLAACAYGFAASQDWLPKSEGRLALEVTQAACRQADGWLGPSENGEFEGNGFFAKLKRDFGSLCRPSDNHTERMELPAQKEQVLYIQRRLQAGGYKIKADGKFGKESRRLARDYLAKAGQSVADDAATEDYYRAFLQLEEAGY